MVINDPWYKEISELFGNDFAVKAGYFEEDNFFDFNYYDWFKLPKNKTVIQMSGAFHPFHDGHYESIMNAYDFLSKSHNDICVVVHEDHSSYKNSKGFYEKENNYDLLKSKVETFIVSESLIPYNCSRNFTRLYSNLFQYNSVYFVCGGDRANFALSFLHKGNCIVSGRDDSDNYKKYKGLKGVTFLEGNNKNSSTLIRSQV